MVMLSTLHRDSRIVLHPETMTQILAELGTVYRYADHHVVTREACYRNSVADHLNNTLHHATQIIQHSIPDLDVQSTLATVARNLILPHDNGEIYCEPCTALGETDPQLQQQLKIANLVGLEAEIAEFIFHAGVYLNKQNRPQDLHDFIAHVRQQCGIQTNGYGLIDKSAANLIAYAQTVRAEMNPARFDTSTNLSQWHAPAITAEVAHMMYFYTDIEGLNPTQSFMGQFCKRIEKWEGTHYMVNVNAQKQCAPSYEGVLLCDTAADEIPRFNNRYESGLHTLYTTALATNDPVLRPAFTAMALEFSRMAYETSRANYAAGPKTILYQDYALNNMDIVGYYDDQLAAKHLTITRDTMLDRYCQTLAA